MADIYFPRSCCELFIYIGEPSISGGYGLCLDLRKRKRVWKVMDMPKVTDIERRIRKNGIEPEIISEDLADSIRQEIENLPSKKSASEALNEKVELIFKELEKNKNRN